MKSHLSLVSAKLTVGLFALGMVAWAQPGLTQQIFIEGSTPPAAVDPTRPVERGYITVNAEPAAGGARLIVEVFHKVLNSPVTLSLFVAVAAPDSTGAMTTTVVPVRLLSPGISEPRNYYTRQEFMLDYAELQQHFRNAAPNATGLVIEPGMAMIVKADFPGGHNWGGADRGGAFFLPQPLDQNGRPLPPAAIRAPVNTTPAARPTALDLAFNIPTTMTNIFNDRATGAGLKPGGQIRSRVEGEGKFQLTEAEFDSVITRLTALTQDAALATQVLGPGWTIEFEQRYMRRDANGQLLRGPDGRPVPDPMVDTYYDNRDYSAARNDMAIRYRWTQQNNTGSWNFKPGIGRRENNGVVYRLEYGVDTTDNRAESLRAFADSYHPLNPFQIIRQQVPGAVPSEFLQPSVRIEDLRYKYKLKHTNNLEIEVSIDDVRVFDLRGGRQPIRYRQYEADIAHLATTSQNQVPTSANNIKYIASIYRWSDNAQARPEVLSHLAALDSRAVFDGRPVLHDATDLSASGSLLVSRASDFTNAGEVIARLQADTLPHGFRAGAQKYAFAVGALGILDVRETSSSTQIVREDLERARETALTGEVCAVVFGRK